jgi:hypothetical protein
MLEQVRKTAAHKGHVRPGRTLAPSISAQTVVATNSIGAAQPTLMGRDGLLNEVQAAIGQYLNAEYDLTQPIPDRLVGLFRQIEQSQ